MQGLASGLEEFYRGKRVLVTGHTGFKGAWLMLWLRKMGAHPVGISLPPTSARSIFSTAEVASEDDSFCDVRDLEAVRKVFRTVRPELVFHLAGQAIVGTAFDDPVETFETNVLGTVNLLECVRTEPGVEAAVMITSDKCYENVEIIWGYRETDRLGGIEPYSGSKAAAEIAVSSFTRSYFTADGTPSVASARAGNVVGGGDWSDFRLIPDCIRAFREGDPIVLRSPRATRPWQFVLEPLAGYLLLGKKLAEEGKAFQGGWNFGPSVDRTYTVESGAKAVAGAWGGGDIQYTDNATFHESTLLQLDCTKANRYLGWRSVIDFDTTMRWTTDWYRHQFDTEDGPMRDFSMQQLTDFEEVLNREVRI